MIISDNEVFFSSSVIDLINVHKSWPQLELPQEAEVVFDEVADVVDAVFPHGDALDAEAEGPAGIDFGVHVAGREDVGMDHAAAAELDPAGLVLEPDVHFRRWLGEG